MKKLFLLLAILPLTLYGQIASPPSLALGVAGVVGEKGSIDLDVLAQVISEKQGELKKEFIKKTMFNDLKDQNYTLWAYMYSSMNVLLESESKEAIKKSMLKNSADLALVYGFSELYLQIADKMCNPRLDDLLGSFDIDYNKCFNCTNNVACEGVKLASFKKFMYNDITFSDFFIDLVFDVLSNNKEVMRLGFLTNTLVLGNDYYVSHSAYHKLKDDAVLKAAISAFRTRLEKEIDALMRNYILVEKVMNSGDSLGGLINRYSQELVKLKSTYLPAEANASALDVFNKLSEKAKDVTTELKGKASTTYQFAPAGVPGNTAIAITENTAANAELSKAIHESLATFNGFVAKSTNFNQYDLYYIQKNINPLLTKLVAENGFDPAYLTYVNDFDKLITYDLLVKLKKDLVDAGLKKIGLADISQFRDLLQLITRLDELNKVETYQYVLSTIQTVGDMYEDKKLGMYINTVITTLDTYTILNTTENKVEVAVEDIITQVYEKYANRQRGTVGLYFSIGANQTINSNFSYKTLLPDTSFTTNVKSLAFAGEKIGIKVKLINYKYRGTFTVGETYGRKLNGDSKLVEKFRSKDPLVSDVFFAAYGSGLLYKIADLTTKKEFTDPIMGVGFGIAFFNSLDFNIGYNWPMQSDNDFFDSFNKQGMVTVSFDVKITDYLSALGKKRKAKE